MHPHRYDRICRAPDAPSGANATAAAPAAATAAPAASAAAPASAAAAVPPAFAETLPEDIRGEATFRDIKDLAGLARSYHNAAKMVGLDKGQLVALPAADDEKGWSDVYAKFGRPEAADKYQLGEVKLPEGMAVNAELQTSYLAAAHKAGLSTKQANELFQWWNGAAGAEYTKQRDGAAGHIAEAGKALKAEWGNAYDQKIQTAQSAIRHYAGSLNLELGKALEDTGLGNHPVIAKLFAHLGSQLTEDGVIGKGGQAAGGAKSPAEAKQEIAALKNDADFLKVYQNKKAPGHDDAVKKMQGLYEQAFPPQEGAA